MKKQLTKYSDIFLAAGQVIAVSDDKFHPIGWAINQATGNHCTFIGCDHPAQCYLDEMFGLDEFVCTGNEHRLMLLALAHTLAVEGEELAGIYLKAAELIATKQDRVCCAAISSGQGSSYFFTGSKTPAHKVFFDHLMPRGAFKSTPFFCLPHTTSEEDRDHRVMALCFLAVVVANP